MKKFIKKIATGLAIASIFVTGINLGHAQNPILIHERSWTENISSGVIHEHIQKFTSEGWLNINVLRVNLDDNYTEIDALFSDKGISKREKLSTMVSSSKAVAGINGDFFSVSKESFPLGPVVKDGTLVSSPMSPDKLLPVFYLDDDKNPYISYWYYDIKIIPESGTPITVPSINKADNQYFIVRMYDKNWKETTVGNTTFADLVEVIIEDNIVTDIRVNQPPINMPENGYILVGRGDAGNLLLNNLEIGEKVTTEVNTTPDYENIKTAIGGGTFLVKDGQITNFTLNIAGNHPRTALGITKDKEQLIMVTVDGRHSSFKGVSQQTLAQLMIDLGAYEAVNLDGGGSTTMVVSPPGEETPRIVNIPSDGGERNISNGIGIINNAPQKPLSYIKIYTDDTNVFVNTSRKFYIKGYDKYHNPLEVDLEDAEFTLEGIKGNFSDNTLIPLESGKGTVKVRYKNKTAEISINVLDEVTDILMDTDKIHIDTNSQKDFGDIYGMNSEGYTAKIEPSDIKWHITGDIGTVKEGILFSSSEPSSGAITASVGDAVENILVSVGYTEAIIENFENLGNISFISYPQTVEGDIERNQKEKEGKYSLELKYDFTKDDATRAAYIVFENNGIKINNRPNKIGMWVYGNESNHWIRGNIIDSNGKEHKIDFSNSIDWKGWKWVTANLPSNLSYPISIERIYVVETNPVMKDKGSILFDKLTALYSTPYRDMVLPAETTIVDQKQRPSEAKEGGYKLAVVPGVQELDNLLKYQVNDKIKDIINGTDLAIVFGNTNNLLKEKINRQILEINNGYTFFSHKNSLFIQLDNTNKGIRQTDYQQWFWLNERLDRSIENNIFILMPKPVFGADGFEDKLEAELLHEILLEYKEQGKNIWVIHGGNENKTILKSGIRYIEFSSKELNSIEDSFEIKHIVFTINNNDITYEVLPLFNKSSN